MLESMEQEVCCPYCGEWIVLVVDGSVSRQIYIEDCSVCCCPMVISVTIDRNETITVMVKREND